MPKPVLAAVNGPAVGIGCSLALACDLIVARESAYFLLAFVNIGLVPDGGSSLFVPARVGHTRAAEMAMLGERDPGAQGARVGADQPRRRRRRLRRRGRRAGRAARDRPDALLRRQQAPAQRLDLRRDGRAARARGGASSRRWPPRATSWRASRPSWQAPAGVQGVLAPGAEAPRPVHILPPPCTAALDILAGLILPENGASQNADDIAELYALILVMAADRLRRRRGRADLVPDQVQGPPRPRGRPDPRQHAAGDRLDGRRRGDPRLHHRGHLHQAARDQEPGRLGHRREGQPRRRRPRCSPPPTSRSRRRARSSTSSSTASSTCGASSTRARATSRSSPTRRWSSRSA